MMNRYQFCVSMFILSQFVKIGYKMAVSFLIKHCIDEISQGFNVFGFTFKFRFIQLAL